MLLLALASWLVIRSTTDESPDASPGSSSPTPVEPGTTYSPSCARTHTLTVLTFNIHHGARHDELRLDKIADEIRASHADVVALQEVDRHDGSRSDDLDETAWLARRLEMPGVFGANRVRRAAERGGPAREYGTALLSRYPIEHWRNLHLPNRPGLEQRGLLLATLDVDGLEVTVGDTHLQHTSQRLRVAQVTAVMALMAAIDRPRLLLGDFNDEPGTPPLALTRAVFTDPWPLVGEGDGKTVPPGHPRRRIDYTLADDAFTATASKVLVSAVSDHRAVRTRFRVCGP